MKRRFGLSTALLAGGFAFGFAGPQAIAATIHITSQDIADFGSDPGSFFQSPVVPGSATIQTNSIPLVTRSPYENANASHGPGYGNQFLNVAGGGSATFNVSTANAFVILWGSPDTYNTLTFFSLANGTGTALGSFTGSDLSINSFGHDIVTFLADPGFHFLSYVISSTTNAFEFTNTSSDCTDCAPPQTTPLPAALPLFAGGIAGVGGLMGWRKRRKAKAVAA